MSTRLWPPRWYLLLGTLIVAGGLLWQVINFFLPRPQREGGAPPHFGDVISVHVSGQQNLGVGKMGMPIAQQPSELRTDVGTGHATKP